MPQDASAQLVEAERAELEHVVSALARWPRLSHLLAYMGEKLSAGDADQLNEYNIATEVLGRSKTVFNADVASKHAEIIRAGPINNQPISG